MKGIVYSLVSSLVILSGDHGESKQSYYTVGKRCSNNNNNTKQSRKRQGVNLRKRGPVACCLKCEYIAFSQSLSHQRVQCSGLSSLLPDNSHANGWQVTHSILTDVVLFCLGRKFHFHFILHENPRGASCNTCQFVCLDLVCIPSHN